MLLSGTDFSAMINEQSNWFESPSPRCRHQSRFTPSHLGVGISTCLQEQLDDFRVAVQTR
jgi:hypothetical protein